MSEERYLCPICGYNGLRQAPYGEHKEPSYEVCPCCGFEFGFDDRKQGQDFAAYRTRWIEAGAEWFLPGLKPKDWQLEQQLNNLVK